MKTQPAPVVAVVPVKRLALAKTRLDLPAELRQRVALAFALDTVAAAVTSGVFSSVLVVTSDPRVRSMMRVRRIRVVEEPGAAGLTAAVELGGRTALALFPKAATVVVPGDLPALTAEGLAAAVSRATAHEASFVRDASGAGTTLLCRSLESHAPAHYGPGSASRHLAAGAEELEGVAPSVRHDVDTLNDLAGAITLGVGPTTHAVLGAHVPLLRRDVTEALAAATPANVARLRQPEWSS